MPPLVCVLTHRKQLHWYWNRYFFTQAGIDFFGDDEADYGDDTDHKRSNVCLWDEGANLQNSLEEWKWVRGAVLVCLPCGEQKVELKLQDSGCPASLHKSVK